MAGGFGFGSAKTGRKRFFRRNRGFKALSERVLQRTGLCFERKGPIRPKNIFGMIRFYFVYSQSLSFPEHRNPPPRGNLNKK